MFDPGHDSLFSGINKEIRRLHRDLETFAQRPFERIAQVEEIKVRLVDEQLNFKRMDHSAKNSRIANMAGYGIERSKQLYGDEHESDPRENKNKFQNLFNKYSKGGDKVDTGGATAVQNA
jgi:hypothetical protein